MAADSDDTVWFYKDKAGEWRWNRKSPNGKIVSDSAEGYKNREDCMDEAIRQFGMTVAYKLRDDSVE